MESQNINFLENEFPKIGEVYKDFQFYELKSPNEIITFNVDVDTSTDPLGIATSSESKTPDTSIPTRESIWKSSSRPIPLCHFEIEKDA